MKDLPFDTVGIEASEVQALENTYKALKAKYNIELPGKINLHINKFELFNNSPNTSIGGTLILNPPVSNCYLTFIKTDYSFDTGVRGGVSKGLSYSKYQAWAFVTLNKDFGRVLIRRETFTDKLMKMIHPVTVEFNDDKAFSNKFYVVANDKEKALSAITQDFRDIVMDITDGDLIIEIVNNTLIIGNDKPIDAVQIVYVASVANKLALLK